MQRATLPRGRSLSLTDPTAQPRPAGFGVEQILKDLEAGLSAQERRFSSGSGILVAGATFDYLVINEPS